jgi:hypothetical protein
VRALEGRVRSAVQSVPDNDADFFTVFGQRSDGGEDALADCPSRRVAERIARAQLVYDIALKASGVGEDPWSTSGATPRPRNAPEADGHAC